MDNPFTTLGLSPQFDLDRAELEERYRTLQRTLHPDRNRGGSPAERRLALMKAMEVNEAYRVLRDDATRASALLALHGVKEDGQAAEPAFLMEMMELREALSEARAARDLGAVSQLAGRVRQERQHSLERLAAGFRSLTGDGDAQAPAELKRTLGQLRYYHRFLDEVRVIEDDFGT